MAEKTLADPLSGAEIKEIILQEIESRLNGDCTLNNDLAYAGFTAKFDIKVSFLRSLTPPTLVWGQTTQVKVPDGEHSGITAEFTDPTAIADSYTSTAPDIERSEHSLPIPVLAQTPTGPIRKRVQIERPEGKRGPGRPPNPPKAPQP